MCGVCLSMGNSFGQVARSALNLDTLILSLLAEHLRSDTTGRRSPQRVHAGRCPLRGMRTAVVLEPTSPAARYAAAVSMLLVDINLRDHIDDRDAGRLAARIASPYAASRARTAAAVAADLGADLSGIEAAIQTERRVRREPGLASHDYLRHTAEAFALCFAGIGRVMGVPSACPPLADLGRAYGATATLVDAFEDYAVDNHSGRFNLLTAAWPDETDERRWSHGRAAIVDYRARIEAALTALSVAPTDLPWTLLVTALGRRIAAATVDRGEPVLTRTGGEPTGGGPARGKPGAGLTLCGLVAAGPAMCDCDCGCCDCQGCDCDCGGRGGCGRCGDCLRCCDACTDCGCDTCDSNSSSRRKNRREARRRRKQAARRTQV